jgi:hypothetical protein
MEWCVASFEELATGATQAHIGGHSASGELGDTLAHTPHADIGDCASGEPEAVRVHIGGGNGDMSREEDLERGSERRAPALGDGN